MRKYILSILVFVISCIGVVMMAGGSSAYEYVPGTVAPGKTTGGSYLTSFFCGSNSRNWAECPRWFLIRHEDYLAIINDDDRIAGGKAAYGGLDEV